MKSVFTSIKVSFNTHHLAGLSISVTIIWGVRKLFAGLVSASNLSSSAKLVNAAVVAEGDFVIQGIKYTDRRYHNLESKLANVGIRYVHSQFHLMSFNIKLHYW